MINNPWITQLNSPDSYGYLDRFDSKTLIKAIVKLGAHGLNFKELILYVPFSLRGELMVHQGTAFAENTFFGIEIVYYKSEESQKDSMFLVNKVGMFEESLKK